MTGSVPEAAASRVAVYSTCPSSRDATPGAYLERVQEVARWSEAAGCEGMLIYTDNGVADPWLLAQVVVEATSHLRPLVAVQPIYMHPFAVAKLIATIAFLHGRAVDLNLVAGGFRNDLLALDDPTPHEERYARLGEYASVVLACSGGASVASYEGRYYRLRGARFAPTLPPELAPRLLISGSSPAGRAVARELDAVAVAYPKRADDEEPEPGLRSGIRVGIIARETTGEAWRVAHERFPEDRGGRITQQLAAATSDSYWHRQLAAAAAAPRNDDDPYWLVPFATYKTFCPYLVGSYERVAAELARYVRRGNRTVILDIPPSRRELERAAEVIRRVDLDPPPEVPG